MIRLIKASDASAIATIYQPIVEHSNISFETAIPSVEEIKKRIEKHSPIHPWLVFEINHQVVGYAYGSPHRSRSAYQWSAEVSVYVHPDFYRKGIARHLYITLLEILKRQGFQSIFAGITVPNEKSVSFHLSMGFNEIGVYPNIGYKNKQWHSVAWFNLPLSDYKLTPSKIRHWRTLKNLEKILTSGT